MPIPTSADGRCRIVTTADVLTVLTPIWHDTARDGATGTAADRGGDEVGDRTGYRQDNPAGEAIAEALPRRNGVQQHQRALPHAAVGAAIAQVQASNASWPPSTVSSSWC